MIFFNPKRVLEWNLFISPRLFQSQQQEVFFLQILILSMCMKVRFSVHTCCTETDILLLFSWLLMITITQRHTNCLSHINIIIKSWATFNGICCQRLTCWTLWSFPSEWLKSCVLNSQCLYMISMITNCEIQLDGKNSHLTKLQNSEWSTFDRRVKRPRIESENIHVLFCWWSNMYRFETAFCNVTKYLVYHQALVHGMRQSEYRHFPLWERDHSLNLMTGLILYWIKYWQMI